MPKTRLRSSMPLFGCLVMLMFVASTQAQFDVGDFQLAPELQSFAGAGQSPGMKVESHVAIWEGSNTGLLTVHVTLNDSWKLYSLTQKSGGPLPTKIHLDPSDQYQLLGSFSPDRPPKAEISEEFDGTLVESFEKQVSWSVPIEITGSSTNLVVTGYLEGLACAQQCVPFGDPETKFEARVTTSNPQLMDGKRIDGTHAHVLTWLSASQVAPGSSLHLLVAFRPDPNWHVYAYETIPASMFQKPTLVQASLPSGWKQGEVRSSAEVLSKQGILEGEPPLREYVGPATIAVPIKIPADANPGKYPLSGHIAFQTCANQCDRPTAFVWSVELEVAEAPATPQLPTAVKIGAAASYDGVVALLEPVPGAPSDTAPVATTPSTESTPDENAAAPAAANAANGAPSEFDLKSLEFADQNGAKTSLGLALFYAFTGGFILNFMPCVLPVIGLKVMSFVEQAGADRAKTFKLNAWYVLGMLSIFWALALLAAAPALGLSNTEFGWGQQFNSQPFNITLVAVIFAMALSFLGVWEIPIPGFATGSKATALSSQEGLSGAFFKGAITTVLATPCSGPGLVAAYAFAVNSGSPTLPFLIFTVMGLGMGVPYLMIGAFPSMVSYLPKPGAWMDTFKQLMGFVLLGTVILLMQNISFENLLPTMALLFGLWFACWCVGRVPMTATSDKRMRAWVTATAIGVIALLICFGERGLVGRARHKVGLAVDRAIGERFEDSNGGLAAKPTSRGDDELPWEPFNRTALNDMIKNGETVMVDFTADWCQTCRVLEAFVLNTEPVRQAVKNQGIRTVVADWGTKDPEIGDLLDRLQGSRQIPFLAIFPAGQPEKVIRFSGPYTQATILNALEQAGKSPSAESAALQPSGQADQRTAVVAKTQPLP